MTLDDVRQLYAWHIAGLISLRSERLREALSTVPRENFLGPGPWTVVGAIGGSPPKKQETPDADPMYLYGDVSVALDASRNLYNGNPGTLIAWLDALDLAEGHRVFHLGGGGGYYTAIMAHAVGAEGRVVMAEVDPELGEQARRNLAGTGNVDVFVGDGGAYDPGPCDAILINAGVTHLQPMWLDRLNDGGRLLAPLTCELPASHLGKGRMIRIVRKGPAFQASFLPMPIVIYSCTSVRDAALGSALFQAFSAKSGSFGEVQSLRTDAHDADATCWAHTERMCLSSLKA